VFRVNREKEYSELVELIGHFLDFQKWGFERTYSSSINMPFPYVIYDSEWCRVMFKHMGGDYPGQWSEMRVYYGRSHATNDNSFIIWQGAKFWCWHSIKDYALNFIDRLSPEEAIEMKYKPHVIKQFQQSETWEGITHIPERITREHAVAWKYYGQRLLELFDLRHPDLWKRYTSFLTQVRILEDENSKRKNRQPMRLKDHLAIDKVC